MPYALLSIQRTDDDTLSNLHEHIEDLATVLTTGIKLR